MHNQWSNRLVFVLAAAGSAVGLGNIWKFPYITGEYGGGAFVLVYLACIALIGLPVMMAEILLGRRMRLSPINAMAKAASEASAPGGWALVGWMGVLTGFLILSFYSVVAGWAIAYTVQAASGDFAGLTGESSGAAFGALVGSPEQVLLWHTVFMLMTGVVVAKGVRGGLERLVSWLMPMLFAMLVFLVGYAVAEGDFARGVRYLFNVNFDAVFWQTNAEGVRTFTVEPLLAAMGHAFFTLSLGMGAIMVYGSYMPKQASIGSSVLMIGVADTLVALLAGLAIFPLVFANGLEPSAGPGLVFVSLPIAFGNMTGGVVFGTLFFLLLVFAAWTSAISLIEPAVAWLVENQNFSRHKATAWVAGIAWLLGISSGLSFNILPADTFSIAGMSIFDFKDYLTSNILLPLGGMLIALFVGWVVSRQFSESELSLRNPAVFSAWWFAIRYIAPTGVALVMLHKLGWL